MGLNHHRPSQFMYASGPGSILETTGGPVIVKGPEFLFEKVERWSTIVNNQSRNLSITDFEISERRLSGHLGGARLVRLPSNEELGKVGRDAIYPTLGRIPSWSICENHEILYKGWSGGRYNVCWKCRNEFKEKDEKMSFNEIKRIAADHAVRFVSGCHMGHLGDVPWKDLVCEDGCDSNWMWWSGGGRKIGSIWIKCNKCSGKKNLGSLWSSEHACSGWHWHTHKEEQCTASAHMLQRGSAGLWIPEISSSLDISGLPASVFKALTDTSLISALKMVRDEDGVSKEGFLRALNACSLPDSAKESLRNRSSDEQKWRILHSAIEKEIFGNDISEDLKAEEFMALVNASENGSPPPPVFPDDSRESLLRVNSTHNYDIDIGRGRRIRVVPIERLRVVSALIGFRREVSSERPGEIVSLSFNNGGEWYPAMENFGEGFFVHLVEGGSPIADDNSRTEIWNRRSVDDMNSHPVHIWWHTLSHRLIDLMGLDSGFSSASIRERTYFSNSDTPRGGILLYTSQPGGDGTMGGLVGIAKDKDTMSDIVERALRESRVCSNDPICEEAVNTNEGAACYACCMVSETSCEHRNKLIDRLILVG